MCLDQDIFMSKMTLNTVIESLLLTKVPPIMTCEGVLFVKQANFKFFSVMFSPDYFIHFKMASRDFFMSTTSSFLLLFILDIKYHQRKQIII
jgi:hypothetical protein